MHASAAVTAPYFFLSYTHESCGDADDEPDYRAGEFYRDLCRSVEWQAGLPKGAIPGFMDRDRRPGDEWPLQLVRALATYHVFVPLYSSRYFADEHCGKEWKYFTSRTLNPAVRGRDCPRGLGAGRTGKAARSRADTALQIPR
jgi:hypothetical protein